MGHHCHHHHHHSIADGNEKKIWIAISANMALTIGQVIGGIVSGSLSLIADAVHNFSDAASLILAALAIRIGRKPADQKKTFGYKRAETIAALINLTTLVLIGIYLIAEAFQRFFEPQAIHGWVVVIVAGFAFAVDLWTAILTYTQSKNSMNMRAVFLHNLTDALASIGVIIAGLSIYLFDWLWMDAAMTLLIAAYILWHGLHEIRNVIHLLMNGAPDNINIQDVIQAMQKEDGVENVHHVHIWRMDEQRNALEAHIVIKESSQLDPLKEKLKALLDQEFSIGHSTLEFEHKRCSTAC